MAYICLNAMFTGMKAILSIPVLATMNHIALIAIIKKKSNLHLRVYVYSIQKNLLKFTTKTFLF
jgi:hypothetical protein